MSIWRPAIPTRLSFRRWARRFEASIQTRSLYGGPADSSALVAFAAGEFAADGIAAGPVAITSGSLDAIERLLREHARVGDHIAIEDPTFPALLDLLASLGLDAGTRSRSTMKGRGRKRSSARWDRECPPSSFHRGRRIRPAPRSRKGAHPISVASSIIVLAHC